MEGKTDGWVKYGLSEQDIKVGRTVYVRNLGPAKIRKQPEIGKNNYELDFPDGSTGKLSSRDFSPLGSPKMKLEFLARKHDDAKRKVSPAVATFNLVSTIVGGGALSLPNAISHCGLAMGLLALIYSAGMSAASIDMLIVSSRRTGKENYMQLAYKAYGDCAQKLTTVLIFLLVWMALIAYDVLIGDLLTGILKLWIPNFTPWYRKFCVLAAISLVSPWCYKKSLHSLRYLSTFSVIAMTFVAFVVVYRTANVFGSQHEIYTEQGGETEEIVVKWNIKLWPSNWQQALYVFPVFGVAFLCHFNVLPTHTELKVPTIKRTRIVMNSTIGTCAVLYSLIGCAGYFWAFDNTCGNILLNFAVDDYLVLAARFSLALVLMGSYPLLLHPCRNALHKIFSFSCECWNPAIPESGEMLLHGTERSLGVLLSADGNSRSAPSSSTSVVDSTITEGDGKIIHVYAKTMIDKKWKEIDSYSCREKKSRAAAGEPSDKQRFFLTTFTLISNLMIGLFLDAIMIIWTILGSTISFTITFILPSLFFLKIHYGRPSSEVSVLMKVFAGFMFVTSCCFSIVCTTMVVLNLDLDPCPPARA